MNENKRNMEIKRFFNFYALIKFLIKIYYKLNLLHNDLSLSLLTFIIIQNSLKYSFFSFIHSIIYLHHITSFHNFFIQIVHETDL